MSVPLFVAVAVAASSPAQIGPDVRAGWEQLLGSGAVFGSYADARVAGPELARARALVYETATAGKSDVITGGRAARALWVGVNLEHQAMLAAIQTDVRRDHAWRCQALGRRLRELLSREGTRPRELERGNPQAVARWADVLVRLDAIEAEAAREYPRGAPSLRAEVREVVLAEFAPPDGKSDPNTSPNALLAKTVREAFDAARTLADRAAAAAVQASLALGRVYGYPADEQRKRTADRLAATELNGDGTSKGLYPSDQAKWEQVVKLTRRTHGGGTQEGIVGAYANTRKALEVPREIDLLAAFAGEPRFGVPDTLSAPYRLKDSLAVANAIADKLRPVVPMGPKDKRPKETDGRFGRFAFDPRTGDPSDGGMTAYKKWFDSAVPPSTLTAKALADLEVEIDKALKPARGGSPVPLDGATVKQLAAVARGVLGGTDGERETQVRKWLEEWVASEAAKAKSWQPVLTPPKKADPKTNPTPKPVPEIGARRPRFPAAFTRAEFSAGPGEEDKTTPSDRQHVESCLRVLEDGAALPADALARLEEIAKDGPDRTLVAVAAALRAEAGRSEPVEAARARIRAVVREQCFGDQGKVAVALNERGADGITGMKHRIGEYEKVVAKQATEIATSFSLWGELKVRLERSTGDARAILSTDREQLTGDPDRLTGNRLTADRDRLAAELDALRKEVDAAPRFVLSEDEHTRLRAALFPVKPEPTAPPVPTDGKTPAERLLALRQKFEAYRLAVPELSKQLRKQPDVAAEVKKLGDYLLANNPAADGDKAYPAAMKSLTQPGGEPK